MSKQKKNKKRSGKTLASKADRHDLYQKSVQGPEGDIEFFLAAYQTAYGGNPTTLREDFCGTAYLSTTWVESAPNRSAIAIDLDEETLDWGRIHNLAHLSEDRARRIELIAANVLDVSGPPVDLACAMNFSFCVFRQRNELQRYFEVVRSGLSSQGLFIAELYGGTEAVAAHEEDRDLDEFTYIWEQESYNPIDHGTLCHIHFLFPDRSRINKAFSYDWRLWTIPEVREVLADAGFTRSTVYWEAVDEDGDGTGIYEQTEEEENQEGWLVYIVAEK